MDLVPFNKSVLKGTIALSVRLFLVEWGTLQDTVPCCHRPLGHLQNPRFIAQIGPRRRRHAPANAGPGFLAGPSGYSERTP